MGFWEAFGFFKNVSCLPLTIPAHSPPPGESPKPYFPPTAFPVPRRPCFPARNAFPHTVWPAGSGAEPGSKEPAFERNCCGHARRGCAQAGALGSAFRVRPGRPAQPALPPGLLGSAQGARRPNLRGCLGRSGATTSAAPAGESALGSGSDHRT